MYFHNIIGQEFAKKYLTNLIKKDKLNHAYMFEGIDGVGKKLVAEELSKILLGVNNIENSPDYINIYPDGNSLKVEINKTIDAKKLIKLLYKDANIYLDRKYEKSKQLLAQ